MGYTVRHTHHSHSDVLAIHKQRRMWTRDVTVTQRCRLSIKGGRVNIGRENYLPAKYKVGDFRKDTITIIRWLLLLTGFFQLHVPSRTPGLGTPPVATLDRRSRRS